MKQKFRTLIFGIMVLSAVVVLGWMLFPRLRFSHTKANDGEWEGSKFVQPDTSAVAWNMDVNMDAPQQLGKKFRGVYVIDKDFLMVHFVDGEVVFTEDVKRKHAYGNETDASDNTVVRYGKPLNLSAAVSPVKWRIVSSDDGEYAAKGQPPVACYRKSKMNGMAQFDWDEARNDYSYDFTLEHWIYLALPKPLVPGKTYTVQIAPETNTDVEQWRFTYDIFDNVSEAIHVNLSGYSADAAVQAADLYMWMGDGGARDYSAFEGSPVYLYNVETRKKQVVGAVAFWKKSAPEAERYNFIQSDVWNIDFTGRYEPGVYRLAVEGVGASPDFIVGEQAVFEPFRVSTLGYFYMRIGQDNLHMRPVPRRPLWVPGKDPKDCKVVVTDVHPYHPDWPGGGDRWDSPDFFSRYVKKGAPENPDAVGGHSDALDWDRHLGHVGNIYDMLLPYILTRGALDSDSLGIAESGNGIPDIIDEARNEVDFWLSLRFDGGFSHGLSNPDVNTHILYQAGNTQIAAWANAANAAMLAEAFRLAGKADLMSLYIMSAEAAWNYAKAHPSPIPQESQDIGDCSVPSADFRITAAAWLYNLTGKAEYENVLYADSLVTSGVSEFLTANHNQLYAMAAYLQTERPVHYPKLLQNMRQAVSHQAQVKEVRYAEERPSRRSTDNDTGYFHTVQSVYRTILAHAIATETAEREKFERTLILEADWSLGRNPANMIQMTTASTGLAAKRSIENCYTSGMNDGTPGLHPGHTPYLNLDDWDKSMTMGRPGWMTEKVYPEISKWPRADTYFNTRYVWAHSEFTPAQTMRGKMALYGYLWGIRLKGGASR